MKKKEIAFQVKEKWNMKNAFEGYGGKKSEVFT